MQDSGNGEAARNLAYPLDNPAVQKKLVYDARNYRGVHLTAELAKVVERLILSLFEPYLAATMTFGENQFAYTKQRGARDALAQLVLTRIEALALGRKIGVYCSDVSGAFDRVKAERLVAKLRAAKVRPEIVAVIESWLRSRPAHVVVGGAQSVELSLFNMVFQGTVLGPSLWNSAYTRKSSMLMILMHSVYSVV